MGERATKEAHGKDWNQISSEIGSLVFLFLIDGLLAQSSGASRLLQHYYGRTLLDACKP